jgi:hypothetical protein
MLTASTATGRGFDAPFSTAVRIDVTVKVAMLARISDKATVGHPTVALCLREQWYSSSSTANKQVSYFADHAG